VPTEGLVHTYPPGTSRRATTPRYAHDPHAPTATGPAAPGGEPALEAK
jgi:hypothetical protein